VHAMNTVLNRYKCIIRITIFLFTQFKNTPKTDEQL